MILQVPRMAPHVLRHVAALARLATRDAREAAAAARHTAARLAVAGLSGFLAVLMACVWLVALAWDTPYRTWTAGGLAVLFAIVALAMRSSARSRTAGAAPFAATQRNLELDRKLYAELRPPDPTADPAAPPVPPETQLERSREEIRRVGRNSAQAGGVMRFPRSRTMQVLTRGGPAGSAALLAYLMQRRKRSRRKEAR
jgi:uncharacterized membrane protein YqjE